MAKTVEELSKELTEIGVSIAPAQLQQIERDLTIRALCDLLDAAGVIPTNVLAQRFKELKVKTLEEIVAQARVQVAVRRAEAARATLLQGVTPLAERKI